MRWPTPSQEKRRPSGHQIGTVGGYEKERLFSQKDSGPKGHETMGDHIFQLNNERRTFNLPKPGSNPKSEPPSKEPSKLWQVYSTSSSVATRWQPSPSRANGSEPSLANVGGVERGEIDPGASLQRMHRMRPTPFGKGGENIERKEPGRVREQGPRGLFKSRKGLAMTSGSRRPGGRGVLRNTGVEAVREGALDKG